jgi:hypothetical protein
MPPVHFNGIVDKRYCICCAQGNSISRMALNLAESQHTMISDIISSKLFKANEIAGAAGCSLRSVYAIKSNIQCFSSTKAPSNSGGRP